MKFLFLVSFLAFSGALHATDAERVIRTTAEVHGLPPPRAAARIDFDLCGTVVCRSSTARPDFILRDSSGAIGIGNLADTPVEPGDVVRTTGFIEFDAKRKRWLSAKKIEVLRHGRRPDPVPATVSDILTGRYDYQLVRVGGTVIDEFQDDIDLNFHFLLLSNDGKSIPIAIHESEIDGSSGFLNAEITVTGACVPDMGDRRIFHGHGISSSRADIVIDTPAPDDPFAVPDMEDLHYVDPIHVLGLSRRRIRGTVVAVWHGDRFLLAADDRRNIVAMISHAGPLPACGQRVCAVGLPDTDLYNVNLSNVRWKPLADKQPDVLPAETLTVDDLFREIRPGLSLLPDAHGKTLRLRAAVRSVPRSDFTNARMYVEQDGHVLPVDVSGCPDAVTGIVLGSTIDLTGICILDTESWRPNAPFPRVKGLTVILRSPKDIRVIRHPSWWTAGRLLAVVAILLAILVAVLLWNVTLRRLAERRGRELATSAIAKAESDLKVFERTRLAVELHDSVAQNLTGASLALRGRNYDLAAKTLDSCREDLRNCLWDLRNLTLDDGDINAAIRKTLAPHVGTAALTVRFNVPRERFTDNTAHAILRILRELATNAVRHGGATAIRIAGSIEGDRLHFSVRDNGSGFDPAAAPGMEEGHFGLQGIRDRVDALEGDVTIDSVRGRGTKVTVALHVPQERKEDRT